jgi:hypothetical protein
MAERLNPLVDNIDSLAGLRSIGSLVVFTSHHSSGDRSRVSNNRELVYTIRYDLFDFWNGSQPGSVSIQQSTDTLT